MELHAEDGQFLVLDRHDDAFELGSRLQAVGQFLGHQTVIAPGLERVLDAREKALFVVTDA